MSVLRAVGVIVFVFVLMTVIFLFGFNEGYDQAIQDIRDVLDSQQPSNTSQLINL